MDDEKMTTAGWVGAVLGVLTFATAVLWAIWLVVGIVMGIAGS